MFLSKINIKNFKCFAESSIELHPRMNVFLGINGVGKTALLDAIALSLGGYLSKVKMSSLKLSKESARCVSQKIGNTLEKQLQFPVELEISGKLAGRDISWKRVWELKSSGELNSTTKYETEFEVQSFTQADDELHIYPLLAYYGVYNVKQTSEKTIRDGDSSRILGYKNCLDLKLNNEQRLHWFQQKTLQSLQDAITLPELKATLCAMEKCVEGVMLTAKSIEVRYGAKSSNLEILYTDKSDKQQIQPFSELSDGYRKILNLVADIACRMAILNPHLLGQTLNKTPGIVLIDEVDLHLHPSWQRRVLHDLMAIFPKIQFIVTTHAPAIIQSVNEGNLAVLDRDQVYPNQKAYGKDFNSVLKQIMGTDARPKEIQLMFDAAYKLIDKGNIVEATQKVEELERILGNSDPEITGLNVTLELEKLEM